MGWITDLLGGPGKTREFGGGLTQQLDLIWKKV